MRISPSLKLRRACVDSMTALGLFLFAGTASLATAQEKIGTNAEEAIWGEDFQGGKGGALPYQKTEVVEVKEQHGEHFLRVVLPGEKKLEGVQLATGALEGNRLIYVTAKVRGKGTMGAMVQAANGWTRLPEMVLSETWEEIRIPKTLNSGTSPLMLYFVSLPKETPQPGAVFEIADIRVTPAPPLSLADKEMSPLRFEAEDYTPSPALIRTEEGVTFVAVGRPFATEEIAFPQTSRSVILYVRYRPASESDSITVCTRRGGARQAVREIHPESKNGWQWLAFPELSAEEAGECITMEVWPGTGSTHTAALDAIVIATDPELDPATLDVTR